MYEAKLHAVVVQQGSSMHIGPYWSYVKAQRGFGSGGEGEGEEE